MSLVFLRVEGFEEKSTEDYFGVKVRDLVGDSDCDTVRFFSKRIGCSCLKEMSKQVKSEPKLGLCGYCKHRKERRELMVCALCRIPQYCSKACQEAHWPEHKVCCDLRRKNKK